MKTYILIILMGLLSVSCYSQKDDNTTSNSIQKNQTLKSEHPEGTWKINKTYDDNGNLVAYDSIYSWSSNKELSNLSTAEEDSLINAFKTKFYAHFKGTNNLFFQNNILLDSLFTDPFSEDNLFSKDFNQELMNMEKLAQQFLKKQQEMMPSYPSNSIPPEENQDHK